MKRYLLIVLLSFSTQLISTETSTLFEEYPKIQTFKLKDWVGLPAETITLPVHIESYDWVFLSGLGDAKKLSAILEKEDLNLSIVMPNTVQNVGIFAIDYNRSEVGEFQEYYLVIGATSKSINDNPKSIQWGYFVWHIQLNQDLPIRFGRQVWGHPKKFAHARVGFEKSNFNFSFEEAWTQDIFQGSCHDCENLEFNYTRLPAFNFITPYKIRRSWVKAINEGNISARPFDKAKDTFTYNRFHPVGADLADINFQPQSWLVGKDIKAVGFK